MTLLVKSPIHYKLTGMPRIEAAMRELNSEVQTKIARQAIRAAGKPIADHARSLAPVRSGVLRNAIRQAVLPKREYGKTAAAVVVRSGKRYRAKGMDAWYAHFIEYGTALQDPQPFMRPALDQRGAEAIDRFSVELWKRINKLPKLNNRAVQKP